MVVKIKDKNLYYVGGVVRDEILGIPSFDIDFCYEGNAIEFAKSLNVIKTNPDFGTVRVKYEDEEIDIASTRKEFYPKVGHLPVVNEIGCSLKEDLKRRDFTINAMAKNTLNDEIVDYFNGLDDLKNKKLRVLHDKSFIEDPSRIIRGLKFSVRFDFELDEYTQKLQDEYLNNINYDMSYHRIKKELKETFNLNNMKAYDIFIRQNIYKLLGQNQAPQAISKRTQELISKYHINEPWLIYLGQFDLSNFELTHFEKMVLDEYCKLKNINPKSDFEIYKMFDKKSIESIILYAISVDEYTALKYLEKLSKIKLSINSEDLQNLGIKEGKIYREIFDYLLEIKIIRNDLKKEDELNLVKEKFLCF